MTRRGPKPLPTHLKVLQGTQRPDRVNHQEPRPKVALPPCPAHLSGEVKRQWRRLAKELAPMGLLSHIDREALALLCQAWARWVEAEQALGQYGLMVRSPNKAMEQVRHLLAEFGMPPSSRTRAAATSLPAEPDPMEELLRRHGR